MSRFTNNHQKITAIGLALLTAVSPLLAAANGGFQGTSGDDTAYINSPSAAPAGSTWDGGNGFDTLRLKNVALSQVVRGGAVISNFERVTATYSSDVASDALGIGASTFKYDYYANTSSTDYAFFVHVLDANGRGVAEIATTVSAPGTSNESISLSVADSWHHGAMQIVGGSVVSDTVTGDPDLAALYEWATRDAGYVRPIPPGDEDPQAILSCLLLGPASIWCAVGVTVVISVGCCHRPDGSPGA